jgi:hypothetical protein
MCQRYLPCVKRILFFTSKTASQDCDGELSRHTVNVETPKHSDSLSSPDNTRQRIPSRANPPLCRRIRVVGDGIRAVHKRRVRIAFFRCGLSHQRAAIDTENEQRTAHYDLEHGDFEAAKKHLLKAADYWWWKGSLEGAREAKRQANDQASMEQQYAQVLQREQEKQEESKREQEESKKRANDQGDSTQRLLLKGNMTRIHSLVRSNNKAALKICSKQQDLQERILKDLEQSPAPTPAKTRIPSPNQR